MTAHWDNVGKPKAFAEELLRSLMRASKDGSLYLWHNTPFLRGLKNISQASPGFTDLFRHFAKSPHIWAPQNVKAMAAFVVINGTQDGAVEEPEAIGLFTEKLIDCLDKNAREGAEEGSKPYYFLFTTAAHIGPEDIAAPLTDAQKKRRAEMVKIWPIMIDKATVGNDLAAMDHALYAIKQNYTPSQTQNQLFGVICKRAMHTANTKADDQEHLMRTLHKIERASEFITTHHEDQISNRLSKAWQTTLDALYRFDADLAVNWALSVLSRKNAPIHPAIRRAAQSIVTTDNRPHHPTGTISSNKLTSVAADDYYKLSLVVNDGPTPK